MISLLSEFWSTRGDDGTVFTATRDARLMAEYNLTLHYYSRLCVCLCFWSCACSLTTFVVSQ